MKRWMSIVVGAVVLIALAAPVLAQAPTGTLTGRITDGTGGLPGVTINLSSPNLQGTRTAVSNQNGDYIFTFLPPGDYLALFEMPGFQSLQAEVKVSAAQTTKLDAEMSPTLSEEVVVTGSMETISSGTQVASTITKQLVDDLPMARTPTDAIALAPGVNYTGPREAGRDRGNVTISGSQSYENLWLVNGVVVNENIRGQSLPLFIEDAIQETTASTAGVSAEYGRFAGGVITALTKSGGNRFSGSFRINYTNPTWQALRPGELSADSNINKIKELTLGGFVWKDRVWFFLAGRDTGDSVTSRQTWRTNLPYNTVSSNKRYEGKLTFSLTPEHRVIGSYIKIDSKTDGDRYTSRIYDYNSLNNREDPQTLLALNYNGVLSPSFFVEGQYSRRNYDIGIGSGSMYTDVIHGTLLLNRNDSSARYWSPTFCGVCKTKQRDNKDWLAKGSWFLSTQSLGSHDIVFGLDHWEDFILEENHQSGSDYRIYTTDAIFNPAVAPSEVVPVISPVNPRQAYFYWQPQLTPSVGSKMRTKSYFVNDKWRFNDRWSFNVGVRFDKNDATDSAGALVADDSRLSPRLGASWDVKGNGEWILNASLARYVTGIQNGGNTGDSASAAGLTGIYLWYTGPAINTNPNNLVSTEDALAIFFDWLESQGGALGLNENPDNWRFSPSYPGLTPVILHSLDSPYADEYAIGVAKRLGTRGLARADYIHREFSSFYATETNTTTGIVTDPSGGTVDRTIVTNNSKDLERTYDGVSLSAQYRFTDRLNAGAVYTWSQSIGNFIGETWNNGPITAGFDYPEYYEESWYRPRGWLPIDHRHSARLWASYDVLTLKHHRVMIGAIQTYDSGLPYEAVGAVDTDSYVTNPGYVGPDTVRTYYYSGRGAYRLPAITTTGLSVTYSFLASVLGADLEIYLKPEVTNLFNEQGIINVNTQVYDATTANLDAFNPFTDTPKECPQGQATCAGYNWQKGPDFGKALAPTDYQQPRTFRLAVGLRF